MTEETTRSAIFTSESQTAKLPIVAIVGRPNVGKSSLLNRFLGRREAIVQELPGVTRDRRERVVDWGDRTFLAVDTGGWEARPESSIAEAVRSQAERAIGLADIVLFVVDGKVGITAEDAEAGKLILASKKPALLAVNKVDNSGEEADLGSFHRLGLGNPFPVSALHGRRSGDLLDALIAILPETAAQADEDGTVADVAIVGRPNVGKSTLFNRLVGDPRSIVHDSPGTTRDAVDTLIDLEGTSYRFVDTAGLRRRARVDDETEYYSRVRAIEALRRADVALLVIDASAGVVAADQKVATEIIDAGTACIVLLNKWDLATPEERATTEEGLEDMLAFLDWAPMLRVSALTGQRVQRLPDLLTAVLAQYRRRVSTADLVRLLEAAQARHPHPMAGRRRPRVRYATQPRAEPPLFMLFSTHRLMPDYLRYVDRTIRSAYGFKGTPLRMKVQVKAGKSSR